MPFTSQRLVVSRYMSGGRWYPSYTWVPYTWYLNVYGIWRVTENNTISTIVATTYTTATDSYESLLKTVDIPYIRTKTVMFTCTGLRPFCKHHVFFDGQNVDQYVTSVWGSKFVPALSVVGLTRVGGKYDLVNSASSLVSVNDADRTSLVTDESGFATGYFTIPAGMFKTGERIFRITDATTDNGNWTSMGFTTYTAKGILETRQQTNVTSLFSTNSSVVSQSSTVNSSSASLVVAFPWGDPIAQTFRVETTSSTGCFVTGVEVWLQSKDATIPLTLQIRDSNNGYPGLKVLRSVALTPANITVGLDKPTFFRLDTPLYIDNMVDYAIVLMSNSQSYNAYICTLGQNQLLYDPVNGSTSNVFTTPAAVSKQPHLGSFFMSQNGTTWTADQMSDLAFRVYRADFVTSAQFTFSAANPPVVEVSGQILTTVAGSPNVYLEFPEHGFGVDSNTPATWWSYANLLFKNTVVGGFVETDLSGVKKVISVDEYGFTFVAGKSATSSGTWNIGSVEVSKNSKADVLHPICGSEALTGTSVQYQYRSTTGQHVGGSDVMYQKDGAWINYTPNVDLVFDVPRVIASAANEAQSMAGAKSWEQKILLSTTNSMVTPIVDTNKIGLTSISHILNNPALDSELLPAAGTALGRYISKSVVLASPASSIRVTVAGNVVAGNRISVYFRTANIENSVAMNLAPWVKFDTNISTFASRRGEFIDYTFDVGQLPPFLVYQVKIVLTGTNSAIPPTIKDVRTIALAI